MTTSRRSFIAAFGLSALGAAGLRPVNAFTPTLATCRRASGLGSYTLGPFDPGKGGGPPTYLTADWGFDETFIFCKVTTNFGPFRFPTARMGAIDFAAHEFFMDMRSMSIDSLTVTEGSDGPRANFTGVLRSETRVFSGDKQKTFIEEHIAFGCEASSRSSKTNIAVSKSTFVMTANFDPMKEHAAIFGAQAVFSGPITRGSIIINL